MNGHSRVWRLTLIFISIAFALDNELSTTLLQSNPSYRGVWTVRAMGYQGLCRLWLWRGGAKKVFGWADGPLEKTVATTTALSSIAHASPFYDAKLSSDPFLHQFQFPLHCGVASGPQSVPRAQSLQTRLSHLHRWPLYTGI